MRAYVGTAAWFLSRVWLRLVAVIDRLHAARGFSW